MDSGRSKTTARDRIVGDLVAAAGPDSIVAPAMSVASWVKHRIDGDGLSEARQGALWSTMVRAAEIISRAAEAT
jgi:hypothetical protein